MIEYVDLLGKPFQWGGRGPDAFDCYGLCIELAKRNGQIIPDSAWSEEPEEINELLELGYKRGFAMVLTPQVGDFVTFKLRPPFVSHVGMIVNTSPLEFVHITKGTSVSRERIDSIVWNRKLAGYYRWTK
jgi:cell wall-associated NlpC family hydrolase